MSESSSPLTSVWSNNAGFQWEGKDPALSGDFGTIWITHDFGKSIGWEIKEGRDFSRSFSTDSSAVIINEAAVKFMGMQDPVGKTIRWGDEKNGKDFKIVGVVKDLLMESPFRAVKQTAYFLKYDYLNWMILKLKATNSLSESVARIETVFKKHLPAVPFDYKFADQEHARKFAAEERIGKLSGVFATLAIFISCLGLLGLASFVAEQRTKEIGIRKILGASVANLWQMLSRDFIILITISCLIAIPVAYYFSNNWLLNYEYHSEISWWIFMAAGLGALLITILIVSFQTIKVALGNPVNSLRAE